MFGGTSPLARKAAMKHLSRVALVALTAFAAIAGTIVDVGSATPRLLPRTLADARPAGAGAVEAGFPIDFVAAVWSGHDHGPAADDHGAKVRFRYGGAWGGWVSMGEDGAQAEGQFGTGLVAAADAEAYQVRGVPAGGRIVAINTTDGPLEPAGTGRRGAAGAFASCRSRADWGADESLMKWTPAHQPVQVLTVHHTDTANGDKDPAATIRAIYRFHAVDRGWGDIGYQLLVDQQGVVYEGRHRGATSRSCVADSGDGSDFAHATATGAGVVGAHVSGWNSGNLGVAALGTYTTVSPPSAQRGSVEDVLASLATRHGIDPMNTEYTFTNPANGAQKVVPTISGHRDWVATECPGGALYGALPSIRTNVRDRMAITTTTTTSSTTTTTEATTTTTEATTTTTAAPAITLAAKSTKTKTGTLVDLTWSGARTTAVDLHRDGASLVAGTANDGTHTDKLPRNAKGTYRYRVCETGTTSCSPEASVTVGG